MGSQRVGHNWATTIYICVCVFVCVYIYKIFLGGTVVKISCQCKGWRRCGFNPWVRKDPWSKTWQLTPIFLPGKFHGQKNLVGYHPWGAKIQTVPSERTHTHIQFSPKSNWVCDKELSRVPQSWQGPANHGVISYLLSDNPNIICGGSSRTISIKLKGCISVSAIIFNLRLWVPGVYICIWLLETPEYSAFHVREY